MQISHRLHVVAVLPVALVMVVAYTHFHAMKAVHDAIRREQLARILTHGVFELDVLAHEYMYEPLARSRSREQWLMRHRSLEQHFMKLPATDPGDVRELEQARILYRQLGDLFERLGDVHEKIRLTREEERVSAELEQRLMGNIRTRSQALVAVASRLAASADAANIAVHRTANSIILIAALVTAAMMILISLFITRRITKSMDHLHKGTEIIGQGHLEYRVGTDANDETGQLARAFDRMVANRMSVTASRDELNKEVVERKRIHHLLEQRSEELARSNKELEQFAYVASHDLQEPLRKVRAFSDRLQSHCAETLDEEGRDDLARMVNAAERMQGLIRALLSYSRLSHPASAVATVDLNEVCREVMSDLEVSVQDAGADVRVAKLPTVKGDPMQLRMLFQNLVGNALKYRSQKAPEIQINAKRTAEKENEWTISVRDNGIGINPNHADRIFVIFQRLHSRTEYEGTGIGLSLCRKIVEGHGGKIWVESEEGKGATFSFTIEGTE